MRAPAIHVWLWTNSRKIPSERLSRSIRAGSSPTSDTSVPSTGSWRRRCPVRTPSSCGSCARSPDTSWIEFEVAGESHRLMTLCADDIELLPPDAQPVLGRAAVSARLTHGNTRIHSIEITNRLIRGSNEIAYLTANYKTTFSLPEDSTPRQTLGSHLWILQKQAGTWVITLVSWSLWGAISGSTAHPLREASANSPTS